MGTDWASEPTYSSTLPWYADAVAYRSDVTDDTTLGHPVVPRLEHIGPYRLIEPLGEGGMGVVHLALDPSGRAVALKVLRSSIAHDPDARARLGREVETLTRVNTPRVASVIDADIMGTRPYLVTRYVPGPSLDEVVVAGGAMRPAALLRVATGLAEGIRAIHAAGVVHRDVKPGNVLMEDDDPVLIDFGIAHIADDARVTSTGLVMGTPGYLSPELVAGADITEATDWWGWAATLTFAASGRPPFGRGSMEVVLARVRNGEPDLHDVDPRLAPLLAATLSPDPARRPHTDEVIGALHRYARGGPALLADSGGSGGSVGSSGPRTSVLPTVPAPPVWASPPGPRRDLPPPPAARPVPPPLVPVTRATDPPATVVREGDGRIGKPAKRGILSALAALVVAGVTCFPVIAVAALLAWCLVARTTDLTMTSLVLRRHDHGRRRSDVPLSVMVGPWYAVRAALATALTLILPAVVAGAASVGTALAQSVTFSGTPDPGGAVPLAAGLAAGIAMLWWGPGGVSLRRGSRSMARGIAAQDSVDRALIAAALGVAAGLVALAFARHGVVDWRPLGSNPLQHFGFVV